MQFFSTSTQRGTSSSGIPIKSLCISLLLALTLHQYSVAQVVYALSGNVLAAFDLAAPALPTGAVALSGITAGQTVSGIDFRPNTGELYAIGYNQSTGEARLYTIELSTGAATALGAGSVLLQPNMGKITFDFNPTVDRIRVMGSNTANYRLHPVTGAVVSTDGSLAYAAGDVNAGAVPFISTGAYTNSYVATSTTALYNYDAALNVLTIQNPPNAGVQNTIGLSGLNLSSADIADFDIYFDKNTKSNIAVLAATNTLTQTCSFYSVDLTSGAAQNLTPLPLPVQVDNIAFQIDRTIPPTLTGQLVYAVTGNNNLISFDSDAPDIIRSILPVTGIAAGQILEGIDFRPASGELYGIGYNQGSGEAQLYTINLMTAVATVVGTGPTMLQPGMGRISFDFNPTVDRIRVMGSNTANYRLHPVTGAVAAMDGMLAYAVGDINAGAVPQITAAAYTNSYLASASTTLYTYDAALNVLNTQIPPNNGTQNTVGASGIMVNAAMPLTDMDIFYSYADNGNWAYLSANIGMSTNNLFFKVDLNTGMATSVGMIGFGIPVRSIAVVLDTPPPPVTTVFKAQLSGHQQVFPTATAASGDLTAMLTGSTLVVTGTFAGLSSPIDFGIAGGAHLHTGLAGQNGPVTFPLIAVPNLDSTEATFPVALNTFQLTPAQVQMLSDRMFYVNIHTHLFPGGEIRGQLLPEADAYFSANLFGSNQAPPVLSNGMGALALELRGDTLIVSGAFANLDGHVAAHIAGGAHLHFGLPGGNGAVTALLNATLNADMTSGVFMAANNRIVLSSDQKAALLARQVYANIHTEASASGEIRGQIVGAPNTLWRAYLSGANQYPFVSTMGTGQMLAELDGDVLIVTGTFSGLEGAVDVNILGGAHIHLGMAGANGPVALELEATFDADGKGGTFRATDNTFTLDPATKQALLNRGAYINIHTTAYAGGEIRGQLLLESQAAFTAYLTGSQEIPGVSSQGHGAVVAEISGNRVTLCGSFDNLGSPVNLAIAGGSHVHSGLPGSNGSVIFPLNAMLDTDLIGGVYTAAQNMYMLTTEQRAMLMARGLYVNIHSLLNPGGEIRGNLLAEANAYFLAPLSGASQSIPVNVDARGLVAFEVRNDMALAVGSFSGLANAFDPSIADGAHIHANFAGSDGPVRTIFTVKTDPDLLGGAIMAAENTFGVSSGWLDTLQQRMLYANIHTTGNTSGEIRGQLLPLAGAYFHTSLAGINEAAAVQSSGSGGLKLELNGNILTCSGSFNNLDGQFDVNIAGGAHIHAGENGANGGILFELEPELSANLKSGVFPAEHNVYTLTTDQLDLLLHGEFYANIHTTAVASGEIRGQILTEPNLFPDSAMLTAPLPGTIINVQGAPTDMVNITWMPALDPNGDKVAYVWQVALDADFSTILYMQSRSDLLVGLTLGELDALLAANGAPIGATVPVFHRVVATDGANATAGATLSAGLKRGVVVGTTELLANTFGLTILPNVTLGTPVTVKIDAKANSEGRLFVFNGQGQVIAERPITLNEGVQQFALPFEAYAPGLYYVSLKTAQGTLPAMRVVRQ